MHARSYEFRDVLASARAVICVQAERIADSCGYGVPLMHFEGSRSQMHDSTEIRLRKHGPDAFVEYQHEKNMVSIDRLPGLEQTLQGRVEIDGVE